MAGQEEKVTLRDLMAMQREMDQKLATIAVKINSLFWKNIVITVIVSISVSLSIRLTNIGDLLLKIF